MDFGADNLDYDHISFSPYELGIELLVLPSHLKYVFLKEKNMLPIIISKELTQIKEKILIKTLKKNKKAIRWTLDDIKGISPSIYMFKIKLKDRVKDIVQALEEDLTQL